MRAHPYTLIHYIKKDVNYVYSNDINITPLRTNVSKKKIAQNDSTQNSVYYYNCFFIRF